MLQRSCEMEGHDPQVDDCVEGTAGWHVKIVCAGCERVGWLLAADLLMAHLDDIDWSDTDAPRDA